MSQPLIRFDDEEEEKGVQQVFDSDSDIEVSPVDMDSSSSGDYDDDDDEDDIEEDFEDEIEDDALLSRQPAAGSAGEESGVARPCCCSRGGKCRSARQSNAPNTYWDVPVYKHIISRAPLLVVLLLLQSGSSLILESFRSLVAQHYLITAYLTMLVGTGGNAGGQSAAIVLQGLASGTVRRSDVLVFLARETAVAVGLACLLTAIGFGRVMLLSGGHSATLVDGLALSTALFFIVFASLIVGSLLPFFLDWISSLIRRLSLSLSRLLSPSTAAFPVFQVVMDLLGVTLTCGFCTLVYGLAQ